MNMLFCLLIKFSSSLFQWIVLSWSEFNNVSFLVSSSCSLIISWNEINTSQILYGYYIYYQNISISCYVRLPLLLHLEGDLLYCTFGIWKNIPPSVLLIVKTSQCNCPHLWRQLVEIIINWTSIMCSLRSGFNFLSPVLFRISSSTWPWLKSVNIHA